MKKALLTIAVLLSTLLATAQEHTQFLGIGMDEPLIRFGVYLEGCGFASQGSTDASATARIHQFTGTMYEEPQTQVTFMLNPATEQIYTIFVAMPFTNDKEAVKARYMQVFNSLCEQYGDTPDSALTIDKKRQPDFPFENVIGRFSKQRVTLAIERKGDGAERQYSIQIVFQDPLNAPQS